MRIKIVEVNISSCFQDCNHSGHYTVIYDDKAAVNPYRVYSYWNEPTDHGITKHRTQIERFADYTSAMYCIVHITTNQTPIPF